MSYSKAMYTTRMNRFLLAAAAVFGGLGFLLLWQAAEAASVLPHGAGASGVPYGSRAICQRNDTSYVSELNSAMGRWNGALGSTWYRNEVPGSCIDGHVTYTGSQQDLNWAAWFGVASCLAYTQSFREAFNSRAFQYGHHVLNNDSRFNVICLNTASQFPKKFQDVGPETKVKGLTHELGHGLHLDHDTTGAMDTCWCKGISGDEVWAVAVTYASPP